MVQDIRRIILSTEEVEQAIETYRHSEPDFMAAGTMTGFEITNATSIAVTLEREDGDATKVSVNDNELVPVLIRFCIENNIMLPRRGRKSVAIKPSGITLCVALDVETYLLDEMDPLALANYTLLM